MRATFLIVGLRTICLQKFQFGVTLEQFARGVKRFSPKKLVAFWIRQKEEIFSDFQQ